MWSGEGKRKRLKGRGRKRKGERGREREVAGERRCIGRCDFLAICTTTDLCRTWQPDDSPFLLRRWTSLEYPDSTPMYASFFPAQVLVFPSTTPWLVLLAFPLPLRLDTCVYVWVQVWGRGWMRSSFPLHYSPLLFCCHLPQYTLRSYSPFILLYSIFSISQIPRLLSLVTLEVFLRA